MLASNLKQGDKNLILVVETIKGKKFKKIVTIEIVSIEENGEIDDAYLKNNGFK